MSSTLNLIAIYKLTIIYLSKVGQKSRLKIYKYDCKSSERSGSVVGCLTPDRVAAGSSLTGVTALWSLSKTHLS